MYNCIFSAYCTNPQCDKSCPSLAETSYLLDRNNIGMDNPALSASEESILIAQKVLKKCKDKIVGTWVSSNNPEGTADLFTYCAICENWKGSRLHCVVYHLNFARYVELVKASWSSNRKSEELQYMDIWIASSSVLIVSGFRYMRFNDFECQTMLNMLDTRMVKRKTTLVVTTDIGSLVGNSVDFLPRLKAILGGAVIEC